MSKIFLTGATGYLGGEVLYAIKSKLSPSRTNVSCLVRDSSKAEIVLSAFPEGVRIVNGSLDDVDVIESESANADIVIHLASTGHVPSAEAIQRGLSRRSQESPAYWIQMSGASLFSIPEIKASSFGESSEISYNDLDGVDQVLSVIGNNASRAVDNIIVSQDPSRIHTALIVGPLIYGRGHGPVNRRSIQAPEIARNTINGGQGFRFGKGLSKWSNVHVSDVADLIVRLVEAALDKRDGVWNLDGIYLPENGIMTFGNLCELIAQEAHTQGLIKSPKIERTLTTEEANAATSHGAVLWGTNAIIKSPRARKLLGWAPSGESLEALLPEMVKTEAERLKK